MIGLFRIFGRADGLKALDQALLDFGVHPGAIPEAVKLATIRLMRKASGAGYVLSDRDYETAAELMSYAILGPDQFVASNSLDAARLAGERVDMAIAAGENLDAELLLLTLHADLIHSRVSDQFEIETDE